MIVKMIKDHTSGLHAAVETKNRLNNRLRASDAKEKLIQTCRLRKISRSCLQKYRVSSVCDLSRVLTAGVYARSENASLVSIVCTCKWPCVGWVDCRSSSADAGNDLADWQPGLRAVVQEAEGRHVQRLVQGGREGRPYTHDPMGSERHPRQSVQNTHRLAIMWTSLDLSFSLYSLR